MGLFAKINNNNKVVNIIEAKKAFVNKLNGTWVEVTKNNTNRKKKVGIGWNYDSINNVLYPKKPFKGWRLNSEFEWEPPTPKPETSRKRDYRWNESTLTWDEYKITRIGDIIKIEIQ